MNLQRLNVRSSDGDGDETLQIGLLLRMTARQDARDRLPRVTTRFDGGGGRWEGDSRTFEALEEDDGTRMGCSEFKEGQNAQSCGSMACSADATQCET